MIPRQPPTNNCKRKKKRIRKNHSLRSERSHNLSFQAANTLPHCKSIISFCWSSNIVLAIRRLTCFWMRTAAFHLFIKISNSHLAFSPRTTTRHTIPIKGIKVKHPEIQSSKILLENENEVFYQ